MTKQLIDIWKDYNYKSIDHNRPTLTTYLLEDAKIRGAVLICPGGGYGFTSPREAEPIAKQFNAIGLHAFVLDYSVAPYKHPQPLHDVARSMCILRENASLWHINSQDITLCGFSAGGHLAASLGVHWEHELFNDINGIKIGDNKPNRLILAYPVISSGDFCHQGSMDNLLGLDPSEELLDFMSLENHITSSTPPTFLWHTFEDGAVPLENTLYFAQGLRKHKIPFEMHIFPEGGHGLSLATPETSDLAVQINPHVAHWMPLCLEWLQL